MRLILEKWNKFLKEQVLNEASEQEIEYLNDALEIPIEQLPFGNIFGNSYRIIEPLDSLDENSSFGVAIRALEKMGWEVGSPKDGKILCYKTKISHYIDGKGIQGISRKTISLNLPKVLSGIINFVKNVRDKIKIEAGAEIFTAAKRFAEAMKEGELDKIPKDVKYLAPYDEFIKHTADEFRKIMKFYDSQEYWLGTSTSLKMEEFFIQSNINFEAFENFAKYASDSFDDLFANINQYFQKNYIIYSRHPIDVFRMSDHQSIETCHSLPSANKQIGFDSFNKCALSEVYGNGMIAYIVPAKNFKMFPPTQESLNKINNKEIFYDAARPNAGGELIPTSRIRIKHVVFHKDKNSEPIRIAVPQGKIYGSKVPGFLNAVDNKITKSQEKEIKEIIKQGVKDIDKPTIDLSNFTRYGGSYQDVGYTVAETLPMLFRKYNKDVVLQGNSVKYNPDIEETLIASIGLDPTYILSQSLNRIFNRHTSEFISFDWDIMEGWSGQTTYTWKLIVIFKIIISSDADVSELKSIIEDTIDNDFPKHYQLPESYFISYEKDEADKWIVEIVYNGVELNNETFFLEGLEENLPDIIEKMKIFNYHLDDGPIRLIEKNLKQYINIKTEEINLNNILKKYDLPNDSWWLENEREEYDDGFGGKYISFVAFETKGSVNVYKIKEKIPQNMRQNAYELMANFLNTIFDVDDLSGKLALNQDTWNKETDPNIVIMHAEQGDVTLEQIEEADEIEFKASVSMYNEYPKEILEKTANFLKNNANIDHIAERIEAELEKYLAKMLKPQQNITENKKRLRIHVRR